MTHGYAVFALGRFSMFKDLAPHFRVIIFDNGSWGGNTRIAYSRGLESPEKADEVMVEWLTGFFAAIDHLLPPKYNLFATSGFGYTMSLFASAFPDRIEKLYLGSPAGFTGVTDY